MNRYELISIIALIALIGSLCPALGADSAEDTLDEGLVIPMCRYINASETHQMNFSVSSNVTTASFLLDWGNATSELEMELVTPSGVRIDSAVEEPITFNMSENAIYYIVPGPEPGVWTAEIIANNISEMGEEYCAYSYMEEDEVAEDGVVADGAAITDIASNSSGEVLPSEECEECSSE